MNDFDAALAVDKALTDQEREAFLASWTQLNPHWDGAQVADVLAELANADAHLYFTEPLYEEHGADVFEPGLLAAAAHAVLYIGWGHPARRQWRADWPEVEALVKRVQAALPTIPVHRFEVTVRVNPYALAEWNDGLAKLSNRVGQGGTFDSDPSSWDWDELVRAVVGEGVAVADITDYSTDADPEVDRLDRALARGEV